MTIIPKLTVISTVGAALAFALFISACGAATTPPKATSGGTVKYAEAVGATPDYIFPMLSSTYYTIANYSQFVQLQYDSVFWFGENGEPVWNPSLSVAHKPVFSDNNTIVTITLKHWIWSDGAPITARDVIFWLNLVSAVTDPHAPTIGSSSAPGPGWGADVPGEFPENIVSYKQTGTYTLELNLNQSYNPTWFLYNQLSQLYPIPQQAWDRLTSAGPIGDYDTTAASRVALTGSASTPLPTYCTATIVCYVPTNPGTATTGALGVAQFLNAQSQDIGTYSSSPLWKVVDGPFRLSELTDTGYVKLVPNQEYSGHKATISAFEELPFTSDSAEYAALRSGALTIGYLPTEDIAQRSSLEKEEGLKYSPQIAYGINYAFYNFTNPSVGPIFKQLYFRQAFQSLVNQKQYLKELGGGVGTITTGPVPVYPKTDSLQSKLAKAGQVYPYNPTEAVSLLKRNGWKVVPGGSSYCSKPGTAVGDCGAGIRLHEKASFNLLYASGTTQLTGEVEAMQSTMKSAAGIDLTLSQASESEVLVDTYQGCTPSNPCKGWQLTYISSQYAYVYGPNYLPTGGELFGCGAAANPGDYCSPTDQVNIEAEHTAGTHPGLLKALDTFQNYLIRMLPVVWMPAAPYQLTMYKSDLKGLLPQDVFLEIYAEDYSFSG
jgi:peptide/nickel transport system substrate-binding protein